MWPLALNTQGQIPTCPLSLNTQGQLYCATGTEGAGFHKAEERKIPRYIRLDAGEVEVDVTNLVTPEIDTTEVPFEEYTTVTEQELYDLLRQKMMQDEIDMMRIEEEIRRLEEELIVLLALTD